MKVTEIFEARRNPHLNPKSDFVAEFYYLYHRYKNDLYLSFTYINKLGMNPKSKFDTPIGIYTYPAYYVKKILEHNNYNVKGLPFAGNRPYVQFLESKGNGLDLQKYSKHDLVRDLNKLFEYVYGHKLGEIDIDEIIESDAFMEETKFMIEDGLLSVSDNSAVLWTIIYFYANPRLSSSIVEMIEDFISENIEPVTHPKEFISKPSINWNTILSKVMGYDYVVDNGEGIIHHNENSQAVFLNNRGYKQVGSYELGKEGADKTAIKYNPTASDFVAEVVSNLKKEFPYVTEHTKIPEIETGQLFYIAIRKILYNLIHHNPNASVTLAERSIAQTLLAEEWTNEDYSKNKDIYEDNGFYYTHMFKSMIMFIRGTNLNGLSDSEMIQEIRKNKQRIINKAQSTIIRYSNITKDQLK